MARDMHTSIAIAAMISSADFHWRINARTLYHPGVVQHECRSQRLSTRQEVHFSDRYTQVPKDRVGRYLMEEDWSIATVSSGHI